jgi:hypothetical protein
MAPAFRSDQVHATHEQTRGARAGRPPIAAMDIWIYTRTRQLPFHQMPALPSPYCGRAKQRMATLPSHKAHVHALHAPPVRLDLDLDTLLHLGTSPTPDRPTVPLQITHIIIAR